MESNKGEIVKRIGGYWAVVFIVLLSLRISSCSTPRIAPYAELVEMPTEDLVKGRKLFNNHCATCHPTGKSGLGPAIINKPLPEFLIRFQIRNGIGVMPAFNEDKLADDQVENIAEYLIYLRKQN